MFAELIKKIPTQILVKHKLTTVNELVKGPLFLIPESRAILLPAITSLIRNLLESRNEVCSILINVHYLKINGFL